MQKPAISRDGPSGDEIAKRDLMIHAVCGGLATLEESHNHTPVREICSEGVILLDDVCDFWMVSCRMARLQYGAKISPES